MTTFAELLEVLRRLHLLEPAQLDSLARQATGKNVDPRTVTKQLVEQGLLTHFQANQLFKGKGNELLLGSYVLLELLGEGGMGAVYKARNWKLGQVVALKLIRKERLTNPAAVRRFEREIRASAQLNHPNIVRARDAAEVNGTHLLVMEYIAGGQDLHKLVRAQGRVPIEQACRFIQQAAMGLQHAFERGLVHRDIKPHNLILQIADFRLQIEKRQAVHADKSAICNLQSAMVKILDFGLARLGEGDDESSTLTQEGSVMGTMDYLAPEQARDSHTADIRSDLYSLGCTMYFLLTGQAPFPGGTAAEKMYKHQFMEPTPLQALRPETPNGVADIVGKLMEKRAEDRYQAPAELALDLEAFLAGRPVSASATASSKIRPVARSDTSQSLQETFNPFAGLSRSETAADEPVAAPIAVAELPIAAKPAGNRNRFMLMAGGGAAAVLVVLIVTLVVIFTRKPPPVANELKIVVSTPKKPTAIDFAAEGERLRQEEEATEKKKKAEEEAARQKWIAEEEQIRKKRAAEADGPFKLLEARFKEKDVTFASFAKEVAAFKTKHGGTPAAIRAAELLMRLPSPLDKLGSANIPVDAKAAWNAAGLQMPKELQTVLGEHRGRHGGHVQCVTFSPNRKLIASSDIHIRLWDAETLHERAVLRVPGDIVRCLAFSPNGKLLLSGTHLGSVSLWNVDTGKLVRQLVGQEAEVRSVAFSSDGRRALSSGKMVLLCDVESGKELGRFDGHTDLVTSAAFAPDDGRIVSTSYDKTVRVWDVAKRTEIHRFEKFTEYITDRASFSPDGERILFGDHAGVTRLWEAKTGKELLKLGPAGLPQFWRDGKRILASDRIGQLVLWDTETGKQIPGSKGQVDRLIAMAVSLDGTRIVTGAADGTVRLWDVDAGKEVQPLTGPVGEVRSLAFSPDDTVLYTGGGVGVLRGWNLLKGNKETRYGEHKQLIQGVAAAPDGKRILSGSPDGSLYVWDDQPPRIERRLEGHTDAVNGVAFSWDGSRALSSQHSLILLWETASWSQPRRLEGHTHWVPGLAFSPDGRRIVSASSDSTVRLWDPETGKELSRFSGHGTDVDGIAYSPDGRRVLTASRDKSIRLLNVVGDTLQESAVLQGHDDRAFRAVFDVTGTKALSCGADGRVILWDLSTRSKVHEWRLPGPVYDVKLTADGRHLATANGNGTVYILRLPDEVLPPKALTAEQAKQRQADAAKALDLPVTIENSIGMKLNLIPAGRFLMGSPEDEPVRRPNEGPQHEVTITKPFQIGIHEVTQAEYEKVTGKNTSQFTKHNGGGRDHPVETVSWDEAVAFCNKLSELPEEKKAGRVYRLPTEAEWEYACRAGTQTAYFFGDHVSKLGEYAWYNDNGQNTTHSVAQKLPNPWGLYDIHGNVFEWCADWLADDYYKNSPRNDPRGPDAGSRRVARGGSGVGGAGPARDCRATHRGYEGPSARTPYIGFRVVCDIPPPQITNSIGMKLARIPAGRFMMGSPEDEPGRLADEFLHEVAITKPYLMGVHELTIGQFRAFVEDAGYKTVAETNGKGAHRFAGGQPEWDTACTWKNPGWTQNDHYPVVCLARPDVDAFCRWLSKKEGKRYRLPTEAEWEYACRAGTTTAHHTGASLDDKQANINATLGKAAKVGTYPANAFGLHDMHGNAAEWCADWYSGDYYRQSPRNDPPGPMGPGNGLLRGGSWTENFRAAHRGNVPPDWTSNVFGARIVCEVGPAGGKDVK